MKTNAIVRIVLFSIAIVLLMGILVTGVLGYNFSVGISSWIADGFPVIFEEETLLGGTVSSSGSVEAGKIGKIDIEWVSGQVTIQTGDVDHIRFSEDGQYSEKETMVWKQEGGTLRIRYCNITRLIGNDLPGPNKHLTVTVPTGWTGRELRICTVSAPLTATGVEAEEWEIESVSGKCELTSCAAGSVSVDTVSGSARFSGTSQKLDMDSVSADLTAVLDNVPREINMDTMSGNASITLPSNAGFSASLDTMSGKFSSDFQTTSDRGAYHCGDRACRIDMDSMSGDLTVQCHTGDHHSKY